MPTPTLLDPARERLLLLTLAGIQFANILDFMVMMPLGPILIHALNISTHEFGFLVSAYSLTAGVSGLLATSFVDRHERKRLLLLIFALFAGATLACALAPDYWTLIAARSLAGAFGGVLGALVQTIVGDLIPFERRGRASGTVMSAFSLSTIAGVPLSLFLANQFGWRMPFFFIATLALGLLLLGWKTLPEIRGHLPRATLTDSERCHPFTALFTVLGDPNHRRALLFMALAVFSGFTVIPYITIYITANVGIHQADIPLIYLFGGAASLLTARRIGRLADHWGKVRTYRLVALASLLPLFVQTHLPPVPLWLMIICSSVFFILVPGRMVPVMAIVTSAAQPHLRGTFMSLNSAVHSFASGISAWLGGTLIAINATGQVTGYNHVGWLAISATLVAMAFVGQIRLEGDQRSV
jgi:predicted MFS family arabinose efflux permease